MNKLSALILLAWLPAAAQPAVKVEGRADFCRSVLQGAAFNRYLEKNCGFKGRVSAKAARIFETQCRGQLDKKRAAALEKEAEKAGAVRFKRYGKRDFCRANRRGYEDAGEVLGKMAAGG
ncbi:MAG: hypothetical protein Q3966_03050 [Neisseria sp.]|nr:hypothetical protein [Neisseria sp.]